MNAPLRLLLVTTMFAALSTVLLAQYALDANLRRGGSRVNPHAPRQAMATPIYTVNRSTGTLSYNRANAFNDPAYNIYQRYLTDRTQYFKPTGVPASSAQRRITAPARSTTLGRSSYSVTATPRRRSRPPTASGTLSLRAPSMRQGGGVSLRQPQYSVVSN